MQPLMVIALLLMSLLEVCLADFKFEVLLENYTNPRHKLADGNCCNPDHYDCHRDVCNNLFIFCVRPYGYLAKSALDRQCPDTDQKYITSLFPNDKISFKEGQVLNFLTNTTNPLIFYGKIWPGQVQLYTQVYNWNLFGNDFIDDIVQIWSLSVGTGNQYSSSRTFRSQGDHVTLTAKARVMCADKYYGPYCSNYCGERGCGTNVTAVLPPSNENKNDNKDSGMNTTATLNQGVENFSTTEQPQGGLEERGELVDRASDARRSKVGRIVGGVIGGVMCLVILSIVVVVCVWCWRRRAAEKETLTGGQDRDYKATVQSSGLTSLNSGGTYRRINNKLYSQIPSEDREGMVESKSVTDFTISEAATAPSDQSMTNGSLLAKNPLYISGPISSQYSRIEKRDSDVSTCHSDQEPADFDGEPGEGQSAADEQPIESGYSVVTRENMDGMEEASDSEGSHTYSDTEPVQEQQEDEHDADLDFNPRSIEEQSNIPLYENIPYIAS